MLRKLSEMKTGTKILAGFGVAVVIAAVVGWVGYRGIGKLSGHVNEIGVVRLPSVETLQQIKIGGEQIKTAQRTLLNMDLAPDVRNRQYDLVAKARENYEAAWKVYEPLPQTPEEAQLWKQFVPAWEEWHKDNTVFFRQMAELDALKIGNPDRLRESLERFRGDHYKLEADVLALIRDKKAFDGGDDCTKCRFGVWRAQHKQENPDLQSALAATDDPHRKFHESVKKTKELVAANDVEQANKVFHEQMAPAAEATFAQFARMNDVAAKAQGLAAKAEGQAMETCRQSQLKANDLLDKIVKINTDVAEEATKQAFTDATSSLSVVFVAIGLGAVAMIVLGIALSKAISKVLRTLIGEAGRLSQAAVEGKLQTRGNPELVTPEFRPIVEGVNDTLDAVIGPLMVSAEYVDRISKGDIPPKITDTYHGDFNEIKNNLNGCIDAVNALVADANMLSRAAVEGKLATRADASKHQGDFRKIVQGVNDTIGTLVGHIEAVPAPAMIIDREMTIHYMNKAGVDVIGLPADQIIGTKCYHHFKTSDCNTEKCACARAMRDARPATSETDAHPGKHNLEIAYTGTPIKAPDGKVIGALKFVTDQTAAKNMANDVMALARAAVRGDLNARADESKYEGVWRESIRGMNNTLEGFAAPIRDIGEVLQRLADKDFSRAVEKEYPGAYGQLRDNVNAVVTAIRSAIEQITESAAQFAEGSRVIAESSQSLASGAQTQSSSVEEMTASIEELARSIQAVKENAEQANKVATESNQLAAQGGNAVQKSVESMGQIRTSSTQIAEIIQVISEIASQTNLLALNAAIEAARAGEHGMGFAVVADEVRKLAERSNQAAREISTLIKESTQRVEEGAQLSDQTGESLKQIIKAAEATAAKIAEIATATIQQAANAAEVSKAIQGVAAVTEQSAAGSEEMASSSEELGAQASALRDLVGQFTIGATK